MLRAKIKSSIVKEKFFFFSWLLSFFMFVSISNCLLLKSYCSSYNLYIRVNGFLSCNFLIYLGLICGLVLISIMSTAAQRAEIRNLASALTEQNDELERLKEDLMQLSRGPVHPQYFNYPGQLSVLKLSIECEDACVYRCLSVELKYLDYEPCVFLEKPNNCTNTNKKLTLLQTGVP